MSSGVSLFWGRVGSGKYVGFFLLGRFIARGFRERRVVTCRDSLLWRVVFNYLGKGENKVG